MDIFDASSGRWSTAVLSEARGDLSATSLPNQGLAIFAGGFNGPVLACLCVLAVAVCCVENRGTGFGLLGGIVRASSRCR